MGMNTQQNPYNQQQPPQMGQSGMMPPQMPPLPPRGQWQRRAMNAIGKVKKAFPAWLMQYGIFVYILSLAVVGLVYSNHLMPWYYIVAGIISVGVFFLYGRTLVNNQSVERVRKEKTYERRIFIISFVIRVVWMVLIYVIFMQNYGDSFGFENGDATFYDELGKDFAISMRNGNFSEMWTRYNVKIDLSDLGYGVYVGIIYWLTGDSIIVVRLLKCIWSTLTVLLIYRLTQRNFNKQIARIAAILCALWPNFWYYCGTHLKETEMTFLAVLFVEQADQMLRSRQFTAWKVIPVLLIAAILFTFRTPLALVAVLALVFAVVMSSSKVVTWGKRIIVGVLAILLIGVTMGERIEEQASTLYEQVSSGQQEKNMEWRTRRENGNAFAKYAGKSVFAPLIFTIPFPSMVRPFEGQDVQQLLNGGNFVKNIISFFTIFAIVMLLLTSNWKDHLLPLSFLLAYLVVLTMSQFAQSERFHQPAMPLEFMFAAYGLSIVVTKQKYKRWFTYWCGVMFVACIAWNWFKIAGRGLA